MQACLLGCMTTPAQGNVIPPGCLYACDNGKFGKGWPGGQAWFAWLKATIGRYGPSRCLWAVAPDVPMDAAAPLAHSLPRLEAIRSLGVPVVFAAQDGSEHGLIPWDSTDVLFLAGSTGWKPSTAAHRLALEAHERGLAVHMGRVNSRRRHLPHLRPRHQPPPAPGLNERTPHHPNPVRRRHMTTWLRYVGASIIGLLSPVPSTATSPMSEEEGAWVRAHAWRKALRKIDDGYPHGFHWWCSCEARTCHPCRTGHHDRCVSRNGPRVDEHAGTMTDRGGFVVAVILYRPGRHPCRWKCPCTHPADVEETADKGGPGKPAAAERIVPAHGPAPDSEGQLPLFPQAREDGEAP
jgi:hypothetical protein